MFKIAYNQGIMNKNHVIIILGLLVALIPFLGFPGAWKTFFITVSGLVIALISFLIIAKERSMKPLESSSYKPEKTSAVTPLSVEDVRTDGDAPTRL